MKMGDYWPVDSDGPPFLCHGDSIFLSVILSIFLDDFLNLSNASYRVGALSFLFDRLRCVVTSGSLLDWVDVQTYDLLFLRCRVSLTPIWTNRGYFLRLFVRVWTHWLLRGQTTFTALFF